MNPVAMMIAQIGFQAVSGIMQGREATKAAEREMAVAAQNNARVQEELTRQQEDLNEATRQRKSDRIRQAEEELGFIRVAQAEGSGLGTAAIFEAGYLEGLDLSRIEQNRTSESDSLQSRKAASAQGAQVTINNAASEAKARQRAAMMNTLGSGLQIYSNHQSNQRIEEAARNRTPRR